MSTIDCEKLRQRINSEDALLNSRATIFLATNALWMAAIGVGGLEDLKLLIILTGLALSAAWFICGRQSRNVIAALTETCQKKCADDPVEKIVRDALWKPGWKSPTDLIGWEIPCLFVVAWLIFLVFELL